MEFDSLIDVGAFARVYKARLHKVPKAVKIIDVTNCNDSIIEIDILARLSHPNLLSLDTILTQENSYTVGLVMPLGKITLTDAIAGFDSEMMLSTMGDIASGLAFLHENNICHLDVKIDNIILFEEDRVVAKLADFGTSLVIYPGEYIYSSTPRITFPYRPPEVHCPPIMYKYCIQNDIWSMGLVFLSIITRKFPFSTGPSERAYLNRIYQTDMITQRVKKAVLDKNLRSLMLKMFKRDPSKRPTSSEVAMEFDSLRTGMVISPIGYDKIPKEKRKHAMQIYKSYAKNINPKVETFFYYFDLLFRTEKYFNEEDDFGMRCSACFAIAQCLSTGDAILPIEDESEKPIYIKYETYIIVKLKGELKNPNLPLCTVDLKTDLKNMVNSKYASCSSGTPLRSMKYLDNVMLFPK